MPTIGGFGRKYRTYNFDSTSHTNVKMPNGEIRRISHNISNLGMMIADKGQKELEGKNV